MNAIVEMAGPTWFVVDEREGRRTLAEQMIGLDGALAECAGKTVCDYGCAEGLIAIEFAKAGAASVYGCDYNAPMIETARQLAAAGPKPHPRFEHVDLHDVMRGDSGEARGYDIVLALAIVHKLRDPAVGVEFIADSCRDLAVFRLPLGSVGHIQGKHSRQECDVPRVMRGRGFVLERSVPGPRKELVQYYRRTH